MNRGGLALVGWVAAQRLAELALARRNTRRLLARGAREAGRGHYPFVVLLHSAWLAASAAVAAAAPPRPEGRPAPAPLVGMAALLAARAWVMASLGERWTTRVVVLPGAPARRRGPYRWLRHPNYWVVAGEVALLPLALGAPRLAAGFSLANALVLARRIGVEERALAFGSQSLSGRGQSVSVRGQSLSAHGTTRRPG